jgi:GNAT superfamily N-acetyltransferase
MHAGNRTKASHAQALASRVEEACLNAWPALQEVHYDGWLLRLADGKTRRTNSVNVLRNGHRPLAEKIAFCEQFYRQQKATPCFRILSTSDDGLDEQLGVQGYVAEDVTDTLYMDFAKHPPTRTGHEVEIQESVPPAEWISARLEISGTAADDRAKLEKVLQLLALPAAFAACRGPAGSIDALAKGAIHDGIVCINLVATRPSARRQGLSAACLQAILHWARQRGTSGACLQVLATNTPAIQLYRKLGFSACLYRYHYRHPPASGSARSQAT